MSLAEAEWLVRQTAPEGSLFDHPHVMRLRALAFDHMTTVNVLQGTRKLLDLQDKRADFAKAAMTGILANESVSNSQIVVSGSVAYADALIAELVRTAPSQEPAA